ncbi:MAG: DUF4258 domain-containing protein [Candidatus Omnitrophica bacterium]|nr:DUF4258 domain-containing protein [Candidatus Omnitrophota bacterium]
MTKGVGAGSLEFELSQHAKDTIRERGISSSWIERILANPARREPDRQDPTP